MKIKVNKISMRPDVDWTRGRPAVCDGDVAFTEMRMTLKSVALVWNGSEWMAFAPRLNRMGEGIMWDAGGSFAKEIAEHLLEAYQRMGGEMPPGKRKKAAKPHRIYVPVNQLDLVGMEHLPYHERIQLALEEESRCRGAECFTEIWEREEPSLATQILGDEADRDAEALAYDAAVAEHAANRSSAEDDKAGLHRVLGVDAVAETMARAGL